MKLSVLAVSGEQAVGVGLDSQVRRFILFSVVCCRSL